MAEPDIIKVVETRSFSLLCDVAETKDGYRWRFKNAFQAWSQNYDSVDAAFAAAQQFAIQRMVPITPSLRS